MEGPGNSPRTPSSLASGGARVWGRGALDTPRAVSLGPAGAFMLAVFRPEGPPAVTRGSRELGAAPPPQPHCSWICKDSRGFLFFVFVFNC